MFRGPTRLYTAWSIVLEGKCKLCPGAQAGYAVNIGSMLLAGLGARLSLLCSVVISVRCVLSWFSFAEAFIHIILSSYHLS